MNERKIYFKLKWKKRNRDFTRSIILIRIRMNIQERKRKKNDDRHMNGQSFDLVLLYTRIRMSHWKIWLTDKVLFDR